jgi:membrane-associated protease RseP (regulator of RpoE activity)
VHGALVMVAPSARAQGVQNVRGQTLSMQRGASCIPGRVFGITEYKCTSCGVASPRDSAHIVYSFGAEPVVVETADQTNRIKPGDYVVAVNGHPITTRAGADQFAYPPQGTATITVRRNNVNITIEQLIMSARLCGGHRIAGVLRAAAPETVVPTVSLRDFGLTLVCVPICTRTRTRDGATMYLRFDGFPVISNRDGDVLLSVNGTSPQVEEGALILNRAEREPTLQLEVRRDGKIEQVTLRR